MPPFFDNSRSDMIRLIPYTARFLDLSWCWLNDPQVKALTMTPDFDREGQQRFFDGLPDRDDYRIWGVTDSHGRPIGAAGLKHIDGAVAEYWGYIGEQDCWGKGLGKRMLVEIESKAVELAIKRLYLMVDRKNLRARALYEKSGYIAERPNDQIIKMKKVLG